MQHTLQSICGNKEAQSGKQGALIVPMYICHKIEEAIETTEAEKDLVPETKVLQTFGISKKTMANYISSGRLRGCYTRAFNKSRWFFMSKLLGLKNILTRKKVNHKAA